ncbi:hypothetical protein EOPP23_20445 [Endozoicomonas sp. OPT23]|uniref:hypothetical protein n=1 Tax=Endozoicomonas sp. OPT23 TaxID=2072845 RepID=UPI00129BEA08|nr:hypothetical protein [Endozoicomonas sp. OPT23]MRI35332.1 hypothetical protein [Endozoicomonas sp. OPT23]
MKNIKHIFSAAVLSIAAASAQAGSLSLYTTTNDFNGVTARVYMDGQPVDNAKVQMMTNGGMLKAEKMTNDHGRADFNFVGGISSVVIKASANGAEKSQWVKMDRDN